jgi:hypothetical protein
VQLHGVNLVPFFSNEKGVVHGCNFDRLIKTARTPKLRFGKLTIPKRLGVLSGEYQLKQQEQLDFSTPILTSG